MDEILCDELLQEIFHRLPPPCFATVSLVSKRWLRLFRSSTTSLSVRFTHHHRPPTFLSLSTFLSNYPFVSSLSLSTDPSVPGDHSNSLDHLLLSVASSCPNLRHLRFLTGPVSLFPLLSLSTSCLHLSSLSITLFRPVSFHWLLSFFSLKELSIFLAGASPNSNFEEMENESENSSAELRIQVLCLSGIQSGDYGLNLLWRSCKKLKKLQLRSCEGVGDGAAFSSFVNCLKGLQEVELRTCRTMVDWVLLKLAENSVLLNSLLLYDGGSKEGLLQFLNHSKCDLQSLDLRLPLDLDNDHLLAVAENSKGLSSLRLQSCCLVTGEGLKRLGTSMGNVLEELALINCDVVERERGLLTTLGQSLRKLRKLDLSYNEMLVDKELILMLGSCNHLCELKLRGCNGLTGKAVALMGRICKQLQSVDIMYCCGIETEGIELLVLNSPRLKRLQVEQRKLSDIARKWASNKFIEVVF